MQAFLIGWQNFYNIIGSAAATLTGLLFVATTLIAGIEQKNSVTNAGLSAFTTPTFVHFCAVLLLTAILSAPWPTAANVSLVLGLLALAGVVYLIIVMRLMRRVPDYHTPLKDWLWYLVWPLFIYIVVFCAAIALPANPALVLYIIAAAMIALLFIGIHNAWDLVTYLAVERAHPENKDQN